ncbi:MAG: hypothetical protein B6I26_07875 [Desulfobacteraceae bacterium 4572_130]|nr:MAG: hypothetical protein B6I26_07875 [Desulfobacteraceae bacterium 4572_130]
MLIRLCFYVTILIISIHSQLFADVVFIHEYKSVEYMLGKVDGEINFGYSDNVMYIDKITKFNGNFLKRFFGKVKTGRSTSEFNLKKNAVYEIDWEKEYIYKYSFDKISDPNWHKEKNKFTKQVNEFSKKRYKVDKPDIFFKFHKKKEMVKGYLTNPVTIQLNLKTFDKKKNAASITNIEQTLWLTKDIKGLKTYSEFNNKISEKTGVNSYRLGCLSYILKNFNKSIDSIKENLVKVKGYPVKSHLHVKGSYIENLNTEKEKKSTMVFKDETMILKNVLVTDKLDKKMFSPPFKFAEKIIN